MSGSEAQLRIEPAGEPRVTVGRYSVFTRINHWTLATCFVLLALNNTLVLLDLIVVPAGIDLSLWRGATSVAGVGVLLFGLIWESR